MHNKRHSIKSAFWHIFYLLFSKSVLRLFSDKDKYVKFASATAAKFFIVICSMGTAGINGTPAIAGVISTDYDGKLIDISQINTIDKNSINAEITDGNIIVKYLIDRNATILLKNSHYKSFMVKFDIFLADLGVNHRRI